MIISGAAGLKSGLNLLVASPTPNQEYVYSQWISSILDRFSSDEFNERDLLGKQLKYLFPYQFLLTSPFSLPHLEKAVEIIRQFHQSKGSEKLLIYADRDADGICSASILYLFLRDKLSVPENRMVVLVPGEEDKYGLTGDVLNRITFHKPDILIALDNGSSNKESFEILISENPGLKTIIVDHHTLPKDPKDYPEVDAFVNPVIFPEKDSLRNMCTSGLVYLLTQAIVYSYTAEYNRVYLLRGKEDIYVKNGVPVAESAYEKIFNFRENQEDGESFHKLWKQEAERNFRFSRVAAFVESHPETASELELFRIFQWLKMPKILYTMEPFLPLAAVGTIADSMLLIDDNRILVSEGLSVINNNKSVIHYGLREVFKALDLYNCPVSEMDMAFSVCPMVNAAGRMGQAILALNTLTSRDMIECARNAFLLKAENEKRKDLSHVSISLLEQSINTNPEDRIVVAYHEEVHRGISGLLASKLAEKYEKPAMVLVHDGEYIRGSVRSFQNENVLSIIHELSPWFVQYGGHIQAAGFSLEHHRKDEFIETVLRRSGEILENSASAERLSEQAPVIRVRDIDLKPGLWKELLLFAPFGPGNPRPKLHVSLTSGAEIKLMGKNKNHAKIKLMGLKYPSIDTVWFNFSPEIERLAAGSCAAIIAEPQINYFRGTEKNQLRILQLANE